MNNEIRRIYDDRYNNGSSEFLVTTGPNGVVVTIRKDNGANVTINRGDMQILCMLFGIDMQELS